MKDIFTAAATYYRHAPWRYAGNIQAPRAVLPSGRSWTCSILGNGGAEYGLVLCSEPTDLFDVIASDNPRERFENICGRIITLGFDTAADAGATAVMETRLQRLDSVPDRVRCSSLRGNLAPMRAGHHEIVATD